jgi:hypothetical protein
MNKQIIINGIYHPIVVNETDQETLEGENMGEYNEYEGVINILHTLTPIVKEHTLYHEIAHHIKDTLSEIKNEEIECDLLGAFLMRHHDDYEKIKKFCK